MPLTSDSSLEPGLTTIATVEEDAGRVVEAWAQREQMHDAATLTAFCQQGDNLGAQVVLERMQERSYTYLGQRRPPTYDREEVRKISDRLAEYQRIRRLPKEYSPADKLVLMDLADELPEDESREIFNGKIAADCGISDDTVSKSIQRLEKAGKVTIGSGPTKPKYVDVPD